MKKILSFSVLFIFLFFIFGFSFSFASGSDNNVARIMMWPGKVNQHRDIEAEMWRTDADGKSGGHHYTQFSNDYGGNELDYCQKFYPDSVDVAPYKKERVKFYSRGNGEPIDYTTRMSYRCIGAGEYKPQIYTKKEDISYREKQISQKKVYDEEYYDEEYIEELLSVEEEDLIGSTNNQLAKGLFRSFEKAYEDLDDQEKLTQYAQIIIVLLILRGEYLDEREKLIIIDSLILIMNEAAESLINCDDPMVQLMCTLEEEDCPLRCQ